jgi:hypothetical protein
MPAIGAISLLANGPFDLFTNDAGLPRTKVGQLPYEVDALNYREVWGHGHGSTTVPCRVTWNQSANWIRFMLGEAKIRALGGSQGATPFLVREIPERLPYFQSGDGSDTRVQWATGVSQIDQGGNPVVEGDNPEQSTSILQETITKWPCTAWIRYQLTMETTPYRVRDENALIDMEAAAGDYAGARELYRYIVRDKRIFNKEIPIPVAGPAGGFKTVPDARAVPGGVLFRTLPIGDVVYKWIRVPHNWPPYPGWNITDPARPWPPRINPAVTAPGTKRPLRESMVGRVNSTYFDCAAPEGYCWQPEELLYVGCEEFVYDDAVGDFMADYTFRFKYKAGGWNKFLNARGEFVTVTLDGTAEGTKPYTTFDFNDLFRWSAAA